MFTGIVEQTGSVRKNAGSRLSIDTGWNSQDLSMGQSISVNGCCLTVVDIEGPVVMFDLSPETLARTTFKLLRNGDAVNLERGMQLGAAMDGHLVTGHVDGVGTTRSQTENHEDGTKVVWIDIAQKSDMAWVVRKGCIAINGVSLTVNDIDESGFSVTIIPHTLRVTTLDNLKPGTRVNLEFDLIAKYVARHFENQTLSQKMSTA